MLWRWFLAKQIKFLNGGKIMKTKKLKKRSFVGAIALLVISAITLTTSTFAWFSMGKEAAIETMQLTVSSSDGFEISANAKTEGWTSTLTPAEIFNLSEGDRNYTTKDELMVADVDTNYLPELLIPVSCAFSGKTTFYNANLAAKTTTVLTEEENANSYVAFDLYIKSGFAEAQNLYFNQSEFKYNERNNKGVEDRHAMSALRVAFANFGNAADAESAKALNSLVDTVVYEPASTLKSDGTERTPETTYYVNDEGSGFEKSGKTFKQSGNAIIKSGAAREVTDANTNDQYITIQPGINKFRVFIWIEGNDLDCIDDIGSDELSAAFRFLTTVDATPEIELPPINP
jgi:hypothetical protein